MDLDYYGRNLMIIFLIFLLTSPIAIIPFIRYLYKKISAKKAFLMLFFLSILGIWLVDRFTIPPHTISGNGNLGIVVMPFAISAMISFYILISIESYTFFCGKRKLKVVMGLLVFGILFCLSILGEVHYIQQLLMKLGGGPADENSRIYRFPWLNQYTNTIYFNFYTYSLGIWFSLMVTATARLFRKR